MPTAITIRNLSVVLGDNFEALKNVSVELPAGQIIGFIGPSGAGKTTLIRTIVGRQKIAEGSVEIFGLEAGSAALRSQLSYMTQAISVYDDLTVEQNLRYFATMNGKNRLETKQIIADVLQKVDMSNRANSLVCNLSGGQKQRVSLAVALIGYPKLMVLDEPTVGLDPVLREQLWKLFNELAAQGTTLIISSHVMDEASRCQDLLLIRDGSVLAHGSPDQLCDQTRQKTVEESFIQLVGSAA